MSSLTQLKKAFHGWRYMVKKRFLKIQRLRKAKEFYDTYRKRKHFDGFKNYKKLMLMKFYGVEMAANLRLRKIFEIFLFGIKFSLEKRHKSIISLKKYADTVSINFSMNYSCKYEITIIFSKVKKNLKHYL